MCVIFFDYKSFFEIREALPKFSINDEFGFKKTKSNQFKYL
jgi:hypothetical protein